ncbi:TetR family transcriptional regulator C-terminal domain-containing protein [Fibrella aquatilis]|uniref:TetR/AcrR family transcriptional regulator n=1 Tax=Fibrella aquatilis TaxID=2817059 RepID=A0A939G505_9BACT|nr:TetR family transcriptional regulator C-terminal domain-containing protein [Fibrella aquatilis]MBO0930540.1 TetR/AcrR family transcriptional regulator [Fibrella aquatilis]
METLEKIRKAYTEYVLENGKQPTSVFQFAKKLKLAEAEFYNYYASFDAIEADVWLTFFLESKRTVEADDTYQTYSVREKLLAFYYTWIELLKAQRSFVVYSYGRLRGMNADGTMSVASPIARAGVRSRTVNSQVLMPFKDAFNDFARDLLAEGRESREVEPRPFLTDRYPAALWTQALFVLDFWVKDVSKGFEKTDTAIEKAVNTTFDLIGRSPLDTLFDFAKFAYQNR